MWNRKLVVSGVTAGTVLFAAACSESVPTEPIASLPDAPSLFGGPAPNPHTYEGTLDAHFVRIAEEVPGFAGFYRAPDGALNVMMAPSAQSVTPAQAQRALQPALASMGVDLAAQPVNVVAAQYDFLQLDAAHRRIAPVLGIGDVVFSDADEVANRVRIGVSTEAARADVENAIAMLGVDPEMVVVSLTAPIELMQTLRDFNRPVAGGLQINYPGFLCTLGFNVRSPQSPAVQGFVTNSHCTNNMYGSGPLGTPYWQPSSGVPNSSIGVEVHDVPLFTGGVCPAGRVCRWSDAAGIRYNSGVDNLFAAIYRTTGPGSITIDAANPRYTITAERAFPNVGDTMNKVGRTTGWSQGPVVGSCQNVNVGGTPFALTLLCQERVTAAVAGGDSGSPVFDNISGDNVRLVGILWGGGGGDFLFTAMSEVRFENPAPPGLSWITH